MLADKLSDLSSEASLSGKKEEDGKVREFGRGDSRTKGKPRP